MNKKCIGCGSYLQNENEKISGYTPKSIEDSIYCQRCFEIRNYGKYEKVEENKDEYISLYKNINKTNDLVLFLVDIFTINDSIKLINKYINNKIILVITKKDILPKTLGEEKIKKFVKKYNFNNNIIDICIISSNKNYNIDLLYNLINKNKFSNDVYVVGNTNAGKSTFINKMIYNYSEEENKNYLTTSFNSSTTLKFNKIIINDELNLIDTPGFIDDGSVYSVLDSKLLKRLNPKTEVKPRTYQLKEGEAVNCDDLFRIEYVKGEENSFTIYISNDIIINRINKNTNKRNLNLKKYELQVKGREDILINGLCFIKVIKKGLINLYTIDNVNVSIRDSLI